MKRFTTISHLRSTLCRAMLLGAMGAVSGCGGAKSSQHWLDMALEGKTADERRAGVNGLADTRDAGADWAWEVFDTIARTDTDGPVRCAAIRAMGKGPAEPTVETLVKLLRSPDREDANVRTAAPLVRAEAAKELLKIVESGLHGSAQEPAIAEMLVERLLRESERDVRLRCLEMAAFLPRRELISPLIDALGETDFTLRRAAVQSLESLTGHSHGYDSQAWKAWLASCEDPFAGRSPTATALQDEKPRRRWSWW